MKKTLIALLGCGLLVLTGCQNNSPIIPTEDKTPGPLIDRNQVVNISGELEIQLDQSYPISSYRGKKCFLVVTNKSNQNQNVFKRQSNVDRSALEVNEDKSFDFNPQNGDYYEVPFTPQIKVPDTNLITRIDSQNAPMRNQISYTQDLEENVTTRNFYASTSDNNISTTLASGAVLKKMGNHCNVWYVAKNGITVTDSQLNALKTTFDSIYEKETYLFGSNVPNFPSGENHDNKIISVDSNTKVDIIVYDIFGDYLTTKANGGGTFGYFSSYDFYVNPNRGAEGDIGSNACECIHIDSYFLSEVERKVYSTVAHEFQHLLHFVNKQLNHESETVNEYPSFRYSETWFNEMMSMVCEDIMQSQLGLEDTNSPKNRISWFNGGYELGITKWRDKNHAPNAGDNDVYYSYANAYIFGAYLLRNFGGINLIKNLATNDYVNEEAVTNALTNTSQNTTSIHTFEQALKEFYHVILNPKGSSYTLNKGVTYAQNGYTFACTAINLFNYITMSSSNMTEEVAEKYYQASKYNNYYGPYIFNNRYFYSLAPSGISVTYKGIVEDNASTITIPSSKFTNSSNLIYKLVFTD